MQGRIEKSRLAFYAADSDTLKARDRRALWDSCRSQITRNLLLLMECRPRLCRASPATSMKRCG
jgi:hypothetical protein